jgi:predicted AlkP superfamily pyrophosphatase or phosphodiesterase
LGSERPLAALLAGIAFLAVPATPVRAEAPLVIWLSMDGVRHDYPDRGAFAGLSRMADEGVRAQRLLPVFPTSTFPNHVSMATCAPVARHGIVGNRFMDRELGEFDYANDSRFINAEPIWASAERQGVRAASFFWVGSETPWRGTAATYRKSPFDGEISEVEKVDQILTWIDLPENERPGLVLSWWHGADRVGHRRGPDDPRIVTALADQDEQLVRLLSGLDARNAWPYTSLFVTSDHGMTSGQIEIDVHDALTEVDVNARLDSSGAVTFVSLADPKDRARAEARLMEIEGHTVYLPDSLPSEYELSNLERIGDLVLIADAPYYYSRSGTLLKWLGRAARALGYDIGTHGYRADHPDMAGIFYAMGRGVAQDATLGAVSNLDVAPTISKILNIESPRDCTGHALREIEEASP